MNYTDVKNPQWGNEAHTAINCMVNFDHLPEDYVPFTSIASGDLPHTHEIFARCLAGEFGPIAEYEPPSSEELATMIRDMRGTLLTQSDWTQLPDVPQATKDLWATYRQALRDITAQPGFPHNVTWPEQP